MDIFDKLDLTVAFMEIVTLMADDSLRMIRSLRRMVAVVALRAMNDRRYLFAA